MTGDRSHIRSQRWGFLNTRMWFTADLLKGTDASNTLSESSHRWIMEEISSSRRCTNLGLKSIINSWRREVAERWAPDLRGSHLQVAVCRVVRDGGQSGSGLWKKSRGSRSVKRSLQSDRRQPLRPHPPVTSDPFSECLALPFLCTTL